MRGAGRIVPMPGIVPVRFLCTNRARSTYCLGMLVPLIVPWHIPALLRATHSYNAVAIS